MRKDPIDFDSPLGISKREWARVLGVNAALMLAIYFTALAFTLCGYDTFLLKFESAGLQSLESTLRGWGIFPVVAIAFNCLETSVISAFVCRRFPKWYFVAGLFAVAIGVNVLFTQTLGYYPSFMPFVLNVLFVGAMIPLNLKKMAWWRMLVRFGMAALCSFALNVLIAVFRIKTSSLWNIEQTSSAYYALNIEYIIAVSILLSLMDVLLELGMKGGSEICPTNPGAGGCSPTSTNSSPKNSKTARTDIPKRFRRRILWLKIRMIAIQTVALAVITALPWFGGKIVEFAIVYASFCLTRLMLGFGRSLHFKSEAMCVTIGALTFWGLTFLSPSAEASIIMSLVYGAGLALAFRIYWELHDLILYRKAAKTDRYAMLYAVMKGNVTEKRVNGVMRAKGYSNRDDILMVQMYLRKEKVEYIADFMGYAKVTVEKKLTAIAEDLYARR